MQHSEEQQQRRESGSHRLPELIGCPWILLRSRMLVDTEDGTRRLKGALLNDGLSGLFSALATSLPLTTFAQNNGRQCYWADTVASDLLASHACFESSLLTAGMSPLQVSFP